MPSGIRLEHPKGRGSRDWLGEGFLSGKPEPQSFDEMAASPGRCEAPSSRMLYE